MIDFIESSNMFHLTTKNNSYYIEIYKEKYLRHIYWGKRVDHIYNTQLNIENDCFLVDSQNPDKSFLELIPQEFGQEGSGDFRRPSIVMRNKSGRPYDHLEYMNYEIIDNKPVLEGLPSGRVRDKDKVKTLKLYLKDDNSEVTIELLYTVYYDFDVITRSSKIINNSENIVDLDSVMSLTLDLPANNNGEDLELISLEGSWARERHIERKAIRRGTTSISSSRGISSHQLNPFIALTDSSTNEYHGDIWSFSLVYSGNFMLEIEKSFTDMIRVSGGINPDTFTWQLEPGSSFFSPESILVYSDQGFNKMSNIYHRFIRERVLSEQFSHTERPILINNWESTYFDFDHDKIISIANKAKECGIELFVLDDGWFGERNGDTSGLGNWYVNQQKLNNGLDGLCSAISSEDMAFGLWVEPEMVNSDAEILKNNPNWILGSYKKAPSQGRNQYVLDLANPEVVEWLIETFTEVFSITNIKYVKWDMNRNLTEQFSEYLPPEKRGETSHRYVLGLYKLMQTLVEKFPNILFEGCSGGGGRFDLGILYYMPQFWTSDNTDAIARLKIQYGTSLIYPLITMGSHVSACPNHQLNRTTPMEMRLNVAMSGNLGFELDLNNTTDDELLMVKNSVKFYKKHRSLIQFGEFYRLRSPYKGELTSWMFINRDKSELIIFWFLDRAEMSYKQNLIQIPYVDESYTYESGNRSFSGTELKNRGVELPLLSKDNISGYFYFKRS